MSATPAGVTPPTADQQKEISGLAFKVGDNVLIAPVAPNTDVRKGVCRYIGTTKFADGLWVGIELVGAKGKNNGTVVGVAYFKCPPEQGVFVRHELVTPEGGNIAGVTAQIAAAVKASPSAATPVTAAPASAVASPTTATPPSVPSPAPAKLAPKPSSNSLLEAARKAAGTSTAAPAAAAAKAPAPKVATKAVAKPTAKVAGAASESPSLAGTATDLSATAAEVMAEVKAEAAKAEEKVPSRVPSPVPVAKVEPVPAPAVAAAAPPPPPAKAPTPPPSPKPEPVVEPPQPAPTPAPTVAVPTAPEPIKFKEAPAEVKEVEVVPAAPVAAAEPVVAKEEPAPVTVPEPVKVVEAPPPAAPVVAAPVISAPEPVPVVAAAPVVVEVPKPVVPVVATPPPSPPVVVASAPPPPPQPTPAQPPQVSSQFVPMSSDPRKTLSGKTELELLGDLEVLKDEVAALKEELALLQEVSEGYELDLELAKEEKLMLESDMEEMRIKVTIAEKRAAAAIASGGSALSASSSTVDDESAVLMVQLQKSARTAQEENSRLRKQIQEMKEHVAAMENQSSIIDNLTERNLELTDEVDELKKASKDMAVENDELKQLQFMLDEELNLQREQADAFAATIQELQGRLANENSSADASALKLEEKNRGLEEELTKLKLTTREATLKAMQATQGKVAEMHTSNMTAEHIESLISRRYVGGRKGATGFTSRFGLVGGGASHRRLLTRVKAEDLDVVDQQEQLSASPSRRAAAAASSSALGEGAEPLAPRLDAVAKSLSELFGHVQDASNVCAIYDECDAIIKGMAEGMSAMDGTVRLITKAWRTMAATASSSSSTRANALSAGLMSSFDMTIFDVAVAQCTLYAQLQQLTAALVNPAYYRHVVAYCRAQRDGFSGMALNGSLSAEVSSNGNNGQPQQRNVLRALEAITRRVNLITAAAAVQTHGSAGHHGIAASQLQGCVADIMASVEIIHSELATFFASVVTSSSASASSAEGNSGKELKGFPAAVELTCGAASWWTVVPSGARAQLGLAQLLQALVLASAFGCEQSHRLLTSDGMSGYIVTANPHRARYEEECAKAEAEAAAEAAAAEAAGDEASPARSSTRDVKPLSNDLPATELAGRINGIDAAELLQDTLKLLHRADNQIRENYGALLVAAAATAEDSGSTADDNGKDGGAVAIPAFATFAPLRFAAVESSTALLLILRALMTFAAFVRTAEADAQLGLVSDVGSSFSHHLASSGNNKVQFITDAMRFLTGLSSSSEDANSAGANSTATDADSAAVQANEWKAAKSIAIAHLAAVYGSSYGGAIMGPAMGGGQGKAALQGYFVSPLLRTVVGVATSNAATGARGVGNDDLRSSNLATLASLFIQGGLRKDVNAFVSAPSPAAIPADGSTSADASSVTTMSSALVVRREMLQTVAKAAPEIFGGLGGAGADGGVDGRGGAGGKAAKEELDRLSKAVAEKASANTNLSNKVQELELQLWEAQSERNVVQIIQKEVEGLRATITKAEASHKQALDQQAREWTEAYESVEKARQALSREVKQLKSEEKLSPLSASERRQHNLMLAYYSTMLGELLMGGSGMPAPIGLRSDNGSIAKDASDLVFNTRSAIDEENIAELCDATMSASPPTMIGPTHPNKVGLCTTRAFPAEVITTETLSHSRLNATFLSTFEAEKLLRFLHRKPSGSGATATNTAADGESDQPAAAQADKEKAQRERAEQKQREVLANRRKHAGSTLYLTSLPKIRRFTSAEECKEARLGVLLSTQ